MNLLCGLCVKIFNCIELQDFLHSCNVQKERQKEGLSPVLEKEIVGETAGIGDNGEKDVDDRETNLTGPNLPCKRPRLDLSLSGSDHASSILQDPPKEDMKVCCPPVHCVACLGLLEEDYVDHLAHAITDQVTQVCPLGMETFSLAIHVPLSLAASRMGMEICARKMRTIPDDDPESTASESNYVKEELRQKLRKKLEVYLSPLAYQWNSPLTFVLSLEHSTCLRTCIGIKKLRPKLFPRPKKSRLRKSTPTPITTLPLQKALKDLSDDEFAKEDFFLTPISSPCSHQMELIHKSCYVAGRYNKYSRELPQTPWVLDGVKKAETSVQELICPKVVHAFRASNVRFSSSGREDVDVLMLGQGRPFLLELINPMNVSINQKEMEELEKEINVGTEWVAVRKMKRVKNESSALLKCGEKEKRKIYLALVWTEEEVSRDQLRLLEETKDLILQQLTPIRVLHRRTLAVREKKISFMETEQIDSHHFSLRLGTQAGTYIKEFVHGDFGRTQPNLGTLLGCSADIVGLDVLEVELQWPP